MEKQLEDNSSLRSPHQQLDERLLVELYKCSPGSWTVCDHKCSSVDHGHPVGECNPNLNTNCPRAPSRTIYNPCVHYKAIDPAREIRIIRIVGGDSSESPQLIVDTISEPFARKTFNSVSHYWGDLQDVENITLCHIYRYPNADRTTQGICFQHPFNITKRMYRALIQYRLDAREMESEMAYWWIDAISINQYDLEERGQQVAMMGNIYSAASIVAVWIDAEPWVAHWTRVSVEIMRKILLHKFGKPLSPVHVGLDQVEYLLQEETFQDERVANALQTFFNHPWFSRVWVLQEIFMANCNAIIFSGTCKMLFAEALLGYRFYKLYYKTGPDTELWVQSAMRLGRPADRLQMETGNSVGLVPKSLETSPPPFYRANILDNFSMGLGFNVTDPRDKLFGILALAEETFVPGKIPPSLFPDYSKSASQVYIDFTWFCVRHYRDLAFLKTVTNSPGTNIVGDECPLMESNHDFPPVEYPTWCLWHTPKNWWATHNPHHLDTHTIRSNSTIDVEFLNTSVGIMLLPVKGFLLDKIEHVFPYVFSQLRQTYVYDTSTSPPQHVPKSLHTTWNEIFAVFESLNLVPDENSCIKLFNHFLQTIQCPNDLSSHILEDSKSMHGFVSYWVMTCPTSLLPNKFSCSRFRARVLFSARLPASVKMKLEDIYLEIIDGIPEKDEKGIIAKLEPLATGFEKNIHHLKARCLFVTTNGVLGLGPYGTRDGDALVSLRGASFVSVLRASDKEIDKSIHRKGWMFVGEGYVHPWLGGSYVERLLGERDGNEDCYVLV